MDRFGRIIVQIRNLNPEVALQSMLLALRLGIFTDSLFKKPPNCMNKLRERAKSYIQMEEMFKFKKEVRQAEQKPDKKEGGTETNSHKLNKRHKPDKRQSHPRGPRYERYTPLTANRTIILEEAFNAKIPIKLPSPLPPKSGYSHNTEDCWALKAKIEELIQARYLAQFVKRPDKHPTRARSRGHQKDQHINHDADRRRYRAKDRGRQRHHQQSRECQPPQDQENEPAQQTRGVINTIAGRFFYGNLLPITFTNKDFRGINPINQDDPMIVFIVIANFMVSKVFID
ncbi:hypothetical protein JHK85_016378 [Glycine max]|nr:hypothetical protein JHK85_016378 [Glycine max]KAG5046598.1 hypothetical protein JHK86_016004 [Glycine max]